MRLLYALLVAALASAPALRAQVVISEIHYHPAEVTPTPIELGEFLELYNPGPTSVNLTGWCVDGIRFCFGAGPSIAANDFLVLARDAGGFMSTYGFAPDYEYPGGLDNTGERLQIENASGAVVFEVTYDDEPLWPVTPDGLGPSLELIAASQDGKTPRNWRASVAPAGHTAGAPNSVAASSLPPWITTTAHTPAVPGPGVSVVVTAAVTGATSVQLVHRLGFGGEVTLAMLDDGAHGDGAAGDGVYGRAIPGQPAVTLVRYRVQATGPTGSMSAPRTDDTVDYLGTAVLASLSTALPVLHWFIDPVDYDEALAHQLTDETEPALVFYAGRLWDNVQIRVRGQSARGYHKKHWKFKFPQGHNFDAPALFSTPVDQFNLQGNWADKSHLRELLTYETFAAAGVASLETSPVRLQQNGDFFGLYTLLEDPDGDWLEKQGLDPNGALYKADDDCSDHSLDELTGLYEKQSREWEDYTDLHDLLSNLGTLTGTARRNYLFDHVDLAAQINYMAATILTHNNDHMAKNYFLFRDSDGTGRWTMHPWDADLTFGRNYSAGVLNDIIWADDDQIPGRPTEVSPSHPLFGDALHQKYDLVYNHCLDALLAQPEVREMFFRRLRTLMDGLLVAPVYENRIANLEPLMAPDAALDRTEWGQYGQSMTLAQAIDQIQNDYLPPRRTHLFTTHRVAGEIPTVQSAGARLVITEIQFAPAGGNEEEFIELYNPSASAAVDASGWTLRGTGLVLPPGTVVRAGGYALVTPSDVTFRSHYGSGRFIPAEYPDALPDFGHSLVLLDTSNVEIDRVDYGTSPPWPSSTVGTGLTLEVLDPALDNNDPANWQASLQVNGTPGGPSSTPVLPVPVAMVRLAADLGITGPAVAEWRDQTGRLHHGVQSVVAARPQQLAGIFAAGTRPGVCFDGVDDSLSMANHRDLNTATVYETKTLFLVLRTGANVTTRQVLFEQGGPSRGISMFVEAGELGVGMWSTVAADPTTPWPVGPVFHRAPARPSTTYMVSVVYDFPRRRIASYLNGFPMGGTAGGIGRLHSHSNFIGVGASNQATLLPSGAVGAGLSFSGCLAELREYNQALVPSQRVSIENTLRTKWLNPNPSQPPVARYQAVPSTGIAPLTVAFDGGASTDPDGTIAQFRWSFGDGTSGSGATTSHTYTAVGSYTVILTVIDNSGAFATTSGTVSVLPDPCAGGPRLQINEINYNSTAGFDPFDWVELQNREASVINLAGYRFEDESNVFVLPAGVTIGGFGYLVLAENAGVFSSVFPTVTNVLGSLRFGFGGGGERLRLVSPQGCVVDQVTYDDVAPWPTAPDGNGPTLELRDPVLDNSQGANWSASVPIGGTPGQVNSVAAPPRVIGEAGSTTITQASAGQWQTVALQNSYVEPVVVAEPLSTGDLEPATVRVRNVTSTSFELQVDEWDYQDGVHGTETVGYLVMETGTFTLPNGAVLQAGKAVASSAATTVPFHSDFATVPVILSQIQTLQDARAAVTRQYNATTVAFSLELDGQESTPAHNAETVGWVALEAGTGTTAGRRFSAARTTDSVAQNFFQITFAPAFPAAPVLVASMQTRDGAEPATLRHRNLVASGVQVKVDEDNSLDPEVAHTTEVVGYLAVQAGSILGVPSGVDLRCAGGAGPCDSARP